MPQLAETIDDVIAALVEFRKWQLARGPSKN
jgi:hypothetical protein